MIGPTGLALASNDTLYVADTLGDGIIAIPHAMTRPAALADRGTLASGGYLKQPLGLTIAPNGDVITTNAGDGNIVETTPPASRLQSLPETRNQARAHCSAWRSRATTTSST